LQTKFPWKATFLNLLIDVLYLQFRLLAQGEPKMPVVYKSGTASPTPLAGRRLLVIEDEYFIADDIAHTLASFGAEVIGPLPDLADAERILKRGDAIDAALLDINLRNEMVFPLARLLRSRNVPFVFTTGYDKTSVVPEFQDVQVWEKPMDMPRLARALAEMLRNRESRRDQGQAVSARSDSAGEPSFRGGGRTSTTKINI
jgi:DNA-binding NtrC family response regulator